jgi:hypothetical protein
MPVCRAHFIFKVINIKHQQTNLSPGLLHPMGEQILKNSKAFLS